MNHIQCLENLQYEETALSWFEQGGLGAGAARVLAMLKDLKSIQVCRDFYREVLKLSAAGGSCYHGILDIELNEQGSWRLPDPQIKALFEVCLAELVLLLSSFGMTLE